MSFINILNNPNLKRSSSNTWHTHDLRYEIIYIDDTDSITIVKLNKSLGLENIIFKGIICLEAEEIIKNILK